MTDKNSQAPGISNRQSKINQLVAFAKVNTTNINYEINFGYVPNFQAQEINAKTGMTIYGARKIMSRTAIIHVLKNHGNHQIESQRGQKGITDDDFELVPKILNEPETVKLGEINSRKEQTLVFTKRVNNYFYSVVMAIRGKKDSRELVMTTMYAKK